MTHNFLGFILFLTHDKDNKKKDIIKDYFMSGNIMPLFYISF
jgi:hypothetical protein